MITYINTGLDHLLNGMCDKFDILQINNVSIFPTVEDRGFDLCCIKQLVLADATGVDYQNDYNSFLFQLGISTDTLVMYLQKNNVTIATLNSATYGTYYALGSIVYYADQSLLTGYILEWSKVLAAHGEGNYRIKIDYTSLGSTVSTYSNNFNLKTYSTERANGTIRIDSLMNGYLMKERINYKGMNLPDSIRIKGWIGHAEEKIETTNDIYANYELEKRVVVQRKVNQYDIFNLETLPMPKCLADKIRYYHFLANTVFVTDYNLLNYDYSIKKKRVFKDSSFEFKYTGTTRGVIITGKLNEQIQDRQKTNC